MRKQVFTFTLVSFFFALVSINVSAQKYGNFPYEESLLNGKPDEMTLPTSHPGTTNSAVFNDDGLQLTPNAQYTFGAVFLNNRQFTSVNGIRIEFEYMVYGSTGAGGDGLCVFLFDKEIKNPTIGAHGAGIGYAYNRAVFNDTHRDKRMTGLTGAYLGVTLDEFGNNKGLRFQGESRVNGIPYSGSGISGVINGMVDGKYNTRNQVTLRGAKGIAYTPPGMTDGYTGYPVLITQSTYDAERFGFVLDHGSTDARYKMINDYKGNTFTISGRGKFTDDSSDAYRKATVELFPVPDDVAGDGFYVTVKIQHGQVLDTLIYDYQYKQNFDYQENAYPEEGSGDNNASDIIKRVPLVGTLNATIPDTLRIGLAASTGLETNFHVIKHLKISLPRAAEANDDDAVTNQGISITILPLDNDIAYNGAIARDQVGDKAYLDETTFRFIDDNGNVVQGNSYTNPQEGTWSYNPATKEVTFSPNPRFYGMAKVLYDIKGGKLTENPYKDEAYRSLHAAIDVEVIRNPARNTISNKMVTIKLE